MGFVVSLFVFFTSPLVLLFGYSSLYRRTLIEGSFLVLHEILNIFTKFSDIEER